MTKGSQINDIEILLVIVAYLVDEREVKVFLYFPIQ